MFFLTLILLSRHPVLVGAGMSVVWMRVLTGSC
jgi:hypothetical protein